MAEVKLHPALRGIRGNLGEMVFQRRGDKLFLVHRASFEGYTPTQAQQENRERFAWAARYGKRAQADPAARALYAPRAQAERRPIFRIAMRDAMCPPVVEELDLSGYQGLPGDIIRVRAADDFAVVGVEIAVRDAQGMVLEHGAAAAAGGDVWLYCATAEAPEGATVTATAVDRPGNRAERTASVTR